MLCDFATVREGLLHVLGAGVTRLWRQTYPAPLGLSLALLFRLEPSETHEQHRLRVVLVNEDGQRQAELDGQFGVQAGPGTRPGEQVVMPMVLNLQGMPIMKAGTYSLDILLDSLQIGSLSFVVATPEAGPRPG